MRFSALWEPVKGKKSCQKLSLFGAEIARGHVTQTLILNFVKVMNNSNASRFSDKRSLSLFTHCVRKNNFLTKYYSIHIRFMYATQRDSDFFFKHVATHPNNCVSSARFFAKVWMWPTTPQHFEHYLPKRQTTNFPKNVYFLLLHFNSVGEIFF